jgi:UDP-N-acetylmuramate dehydrogenase
MGLRAAGRTRCAWGRRVIPTQDLVSDLRACMPRLRGRVIANQPLSEFTWFRVGGAAQVLFVPEDETDLAEFLAALPREIPVTVVGLGSNLIVRDGGVPGAVIRLGRGFGDMRLEPGSRIRVGAAVPDVKVSRMAQEAAISGLAFFRGIPGAIGGALRMNGGAYGRETKDAIIEVRGIDRDGRMHVFSTGEMNYSYRHCGVPEEIIFTRALFQGAPGNAETIAAEMDKITEARETTQPIKSRTGGSTFKNPPGRKAWQLIDAAGCRALRLGDAQVSELHCNFLINLGGASAADIENLGETVRMRVKENSGVDLEWEIKRIGVAIETRQ